MYPNAVAYAIPFFVVAIITEAVLIRYRKKNRYHYKDAITSISMGLGNQLVGLVVATAFMLWCYNIVFEARLVNDIPANVWTVLLCFVLDDFCYYWFHRTAHERRWFWASHVVHHSSQFYNLSTALRQTWTGKLTFSFIFNMPLVYIGFPVEMVVFVAGVNLVYQFWIHTELVDSLGPLEKVFNTPSHHRVHHATNPRYLDANYAGVFIVWDKLFGTFVPEQKHDKPEYGIIKNIQTFNPLTVALHEWIAILLDIKSARSVKEVVAYLFSAPGWSPDGSRETTKTIKNRWHEEQQRQQLNN